MNTTAAGLDGVVFQSKGCKLLGGFYRGAGEGALPTAILLHGLPGVEKNLDIAYALRESGWNCLYFHYRGCWGSEGAYSLGGNFDDFKAAISWLEKQPAVDMNCLALVGHSAGGYLALMEGAADLRFRVMVALCPLISPARNPIPLDMFDDFAMMLNGVTGKDLKSQYEALPPVESMAHQLHDRPVLMLTGQKDEVFPTDHYPPLLDAVPTIQWHEFPDGDHSLSSCRLETVRHTLDWLFAKI